MWEQLKARKYITGHPSVSYSQLRGGSRLTQLGAAIVLGPANAGQQSCKAQRKGPRASLESCSGGGIGGVGGGVAMEVSASFGETSQSTSSCFLLTLLQQVSET